MGYNKNLGALFEAMINHDIDAMRYLIEIKKTNINKIHTDPDLGSIAPLVAAASGKSFLNEFKYLLSLPECDPNIQTVYGSALTIASKNGNTDAVELLLKHPKIDINKVVKIYNGQTLVVATALHYALLNKHTDIALMLLSEGALVDIPYKFGDIQLETRSIAELIGLGPYGFKKFYNK